jgi:hypothetical protein
VFVVLTANRDGYMSCPHGRWGHVGLCVHAVPVPEKAGTSRQVCCSVRRLHTPILAALIALVYPKHTAARICVFSIYGSAHHISTLKLADLALYGDAYDHRRRQFSHICQSPPLARDQTRP